MYLGPGTPVSAVLSLMDVPTANPVSVPTAKDLHGKVVLASAFPLDPPRLPVVAAGGRGRGRGDGGGGPVAACLHDPSTADPAEAVATDLRHRPGRRLGT